MKLTLTAAIFHLIENQLLPNECILLRLWNDEFIQIQRHLQKEFTGASAWRPPVEIEQGCERPSSGNDQIDALLLQLERHNLALVSFNAFPIDNDNDNEGHNDFVAIVHRELAAKIIEFLAVNVFSDRSGFFDKSSAPQKAERDPAGRGSR
jgi:hypothetical protein